MQRNWLVFLGVWLAGMVALTAVRLYVAPSLSMSVAAQVVAMMVWVLFISASADHLSRK